MQSDAVNRGDSDHNLNEIADAWAAVLLDLAERKGVESCVERVESRRPLETSRPETASS